MEKSIQKEILDYLKKKKYLYWRNSTGYGRQAGIEFARNGLLGSPDIFVVINGFLIGLEIKQPGKKQQKEQKEFERKMKEAGAEYYIITNIKQLQELGI